MAKDDFKPSLYVFHSAYGYGQILTVDGEKVTIGFDHGEIEVFTIENLIKSDRFRFV